MHICLPFSLQYTFTKIFKTRKRRRNDMNWLKRNICWGICLLVVCHGLVGASDEMCSTCDDATACADKENIENRKCLTEGVPHCFTKVKKGTPRTALEMGCTPTPSNTLGCVNVDNETEMCVCDNTGITKCNKDPFALTEQESAANNNPADIDKGSQNGTLPNNSFRNNADVILGIVVLAIAFSFTVTQKLA